MKRRTDHPTITDAQHAMKILGIMFSSYKPPARDIPEGFKRVYVLPFERQPLDGIWTGDLVEQILYDLETSPDGWSDEGKEVLWSRNLPPPSSGGPGRGSWRGRGQSSGFRPAFRPGPEAGIQVSGPNFQGPPQGSYRFQARPQHMGPQYAFRPDQNQGQTDVHPNGSAGFRSDSWRSHADRPPPPQQP